MSECRDVLTDKKMNMKVAEELEDPILDLRLSSSEITDDESKLELNLLGLIDDNGSRVSDSASTKKKHFLCKYCSKKFTNSQALGGHQNAHKRERSLLKKEKGQDFVVFYGVMDASIYPHPAMGGFGSHGPFNRALGFNMHSMIHKPAYHHHPYHHILPAGYAYECNWPTNNALPPRNNSLGINPRPLLAANRTNLSGIESSGNSQCDLAAHDLSLNL